MSISARYIYLQKMIVAINNVFDAKTHVPLLSYKCVLIISYNEDRPFSLFINYRVIS